MGQHIALLAAELGAAWSSAEFFAEQLLDANSELDPDEDTSGALSGTGELGDRPVWHVGMRWFI